MSKTRVLVVEDDAHLLSGIRDILELEKYEVMTAHNGLDGLAVLKRDVHNPPDVIVSDIMMPHMDGFKFLEEVRKYDEWIHIPFIFLTAKGERKDRYKGVLLGADMYLTKPFDAEELLVSISATLQRQGRLQDVKNAELDTQKKKILTILNHEMRTPLTLVVAYAEMLKDIDLTRDEEAGDVKTFLRGVNSGAERLRRLIENFICVVEMDTGEAQKTVEWRKRPVDDLELVITDALRQIDDPAERPRNFDIEVPTDLPTMEFDVQYMTIAIRELLDNAAKFSADDATIKVRAAADDAHFVAVTVQDFGRGIPSHELENIWKPFYQINREQFEDQGSGSGLTIVKNIITLHGGEVDVASTLGEGSTFTIQVPVKKPATVTA